MPFEPGPPEVLAGPRGPWVDGEDIVGRWRTERREFLGCGNLRTRQAGLPSELSCTPPGSSDRPLRGGN